ncbi:MAG TPA: 6,7-dimethyl-8-ribityllumazine synthase [Candidatus Limnocylindria bacterium]|nr:6,7-dimethyl-8-ribityllumazine synthase [Candidatus Limnocylindria bacterium]
MKTRAGRPAAIPKANVALVVSRWNREITDLLAAGAERTARDAGMTVERFGVAGSFELPAAVGILAETGRFDAIVPIGCLIRGETPHFDVLSRAVATGLMELSLTYPCAIPFGVLTCDTFEQARQRAGGSEGNKGEEAMEAAFDLLALRHATALPAPAARKAATARAGSTGAKRRRSPGRA